MGRSGAEQGGSPAWCGRALRSLLAVLALCCAAGALPALAQAAPTGVIAGRVTVPGMEIGPARNTSVCAISQETLAQSCGTTNDAGDYTIAGLPYGSYDVLFTGEVCVEEGCSQPWVAQYWEDTRSPEHAKPVTVGAEPSEVDARLTEGGQIQGVVTDAQGAGVEGMEVCALGRYAVEFGEGELEECEVTGPDGAYTIEGVPQTEVIVEFSGVVCSSGSCAEKYIAQFYGGSPTPSGAKSLQVAPGKATPGINAMMAEGGRITGAVTEEGRPLDGVIVCAIQGTKATSCAATGANGAYTLEGLATGQYMVSFEGDTCGTPLDTEAGCRPWTEYYPASATTQGAGQVTVTAPATTPGINLEVKPPAPVLAAAPAITGTPAVGQVLTCSPGEWAKGPKTIGLEWLRDGMPIAGQSSSSYLVQSADEGHAISCRVTASNAGGATAGMSGAIQIPRAPVTTPQTPAPGGTSINKPSAKAKKGKAVAADFARVHVARAAIRLHCKGAGPCKGHIQLLERTTGHSSGRHGRHHTRAVKIGGASFSLAKGARGTVRVRLSTGALKAIKAVGARGVAVQVRGVDVRKKRVMLRPPAKA